MINIPQIVLEKINLQYPDNNELIFNGFFKKPLTFRVNLLKSSVEKVISNFSALGIKTDYVEWSNDIFICNTTDINTIKNTNEYLNGEIYLQSLSSCIPALILDPANNEDILDMAAAPGGKTTQIASITNGKASITACERHPIRAEKLIFNLEKQGVKNVNVIKKDARQLENWFKFDKILLDAPCSGSGTLNLDNDCSYLTEKLILNCKKTQSALIKKAYDLLKKDGILVYSTCSIFKEENEYIISNYVKNGLLEVVNFDTKRFKTVPTLPSLIDGTLTICPTKDYEGFFVAALRKLK